jgi:hypothetical protein
MKSIFLLEESSLLLGIDAETLARIAIADFTGRKIKEMVKNYSY